MHNPDSCKVLQDALQDDFWFFRKMAAAAFKDYKGKDLAAVASLLIELSKNDKKPAVQAAAVDTLASFQHPAQYVAVYKQGMAARSYHLSSTALYAYATTSNEPDKLAYLANFEACDHHRIIVALANYYTATKQPDKYAWFKAKLTSLQGSISAYPLIVTLGKYLAVIPDEKSQADGLDLLKKIAARTERAYIQSAIYEALRHMRQVEGAQTLLNDLKANKQLAK